MMTCHIVTWLKTAWRHRAAVPPALASLLALLCLPAPVAAQHTPPRNIESWGVCPFECCTYRAWTADDDIAVHQRRSDRSAIVFHLHPGEALDALTGVVVTARPALVRIDRPVRDGYLKDSDTPQLSLKNGDAIYMLSPLGEGAYLFWYRGKIYRSGADLAAMPGIDARDSGMTWWKLVRNKDGKSGWTRSARFRNADDCG